MREAWRIQCGRCCLPNFLETAEGRRILKDLKQFADSLSIPISPTFALVAISMEKMIVGFGLISEAW